MENQLNITKTRSSELFQVAKNLFPGGVNSPVRAFKSVDGTPLFIKKGNGAYIWDEDDNKFIDFCCSWGPLILGHNNESIRENITKTIQNGLTFGAPTSLENELASLILDNHSYIQKIRFVSSGTEAVMSALRLARAYTKRNKIIKFEGCYHGHVDSLLVKAGSGLVTLGEADSAGISNVVANDTIVLPLNNIDILKQTFDKYKDQIAAVIIEPIPANNGLLLQAKNFLEDLRVITKENNTLLIFDEVISGFRVGFEGAAGYYKIQPDIITFGKIIGGGMPVGAYGASHELMSMIAPDGPVYQAGTLSGNPVAMSAGIAQLTELLREDFYEQLNHSTEDFVKTIKQHVDEHNYNVNIQSIGSIFWIAFTDKTKISAASEIQHESMNYFKAFHRECLNRGVYFGPSGYEVGFISASHDKAILEKASKVITKALDVIFKK